MNFTILAKELKKGLSFTEKITGKNLTLPILNNLLIEALPNFLKISSTDLEVGIEWWGHCKTEKEGSIAVPAKFISQLVGVLPEEKIDIKTKGNTLLIEGKNIKTQIKGFSSEEFPIIPKFLKDIYIEMDGKKLKRWANKRC
jgi:DNA polymerase-3 subunit beta